VKKDYSCRKTVMDCISRRLQLSISENDIEIAHQLPNRKPTRDATQVQQLQELVIIARFRDRNIRNSVIRERRKLKGTTCTIVEDLTNLNLEVMNRLRKSSEVDKCWSWSGHIYAVLKDSTKIRVRPFQTIAECEVVD